MPVASGYPGRLHLLALACALLASSSSVGAAPTGGAAAGDLSAALSGEAAAVNCTQSTLNADWLEMTYVRQ